MDDTRRNLLGAAVGGTLGALLPAAARAQEPAKEAATAAPPRLLPDEAIRLWRDLPPDPLPDMNLDGERVIRRGAVIGVVAPRLHVYRPATPNGAAALVIAGGGYECVELAHESGPVCRWLASLGVTAYELVYRLPEQGWQRGAPLQDGQRAMRVIRSRAQRDGIDPARIAILGFSAGGHLAGMTAFDPNARRYPETDGADRLSARPNLAALMYPVLTLLPPFDHTRSHRHLLGDAPSTGAAEALSPVLRIDANAPRTFLAQALDDPIVPVDNVLLAHTALRNARVPAALHVYQSGGHGWSLGVPDSEPASWPKLFARWARTNRWFG
ncbi:alpha/beta hydrolase [Burkholderia plantarii]|uniref:alpha/beta hydrolase n=1 Tax=Burkholderia plantarii TaxID=41899 RepID=UPI0008706676|nr:alpha/beta hydrolase [Burkholderia plantarii]